MLILRRKTLIVQILCTFGCFYQLYSLIIQYRDFKVRNEVSFIKHENLILPDINFLIPLGLAINLTALRVYKPQVYRKFCQTVYGKSKSNVTKILDECDKHLEAQQVLTEFFQYNLKIGDVHRLALDLRSTIKNFWFLEMFNDILSQRFCSVDRYFSAYAVYLRVACRNDSKPITISRDQFTLDREFFSQLVYKMNRMFLVQLSWPDSQIDGVARHYYPIDRKPGLIHEAQFKFSTIETVSLEAPFVTNCKHYQRAETLVKCISQNLSQLSPPKVYPRTVIPFGSLPENWSFVTRKDLETNPKIKKIYDNCLTSVPWIECKTNKYTFSVQHKFIPSVNDDHDGSIVLEPPDYPDMLYEAKPVLTNEEFIIFIGSILGTWFGFSIFDSYLSSLNLIQKFHGTSCCQHTVSTLRV